MTTYYLVLPCHNRHARSALSPLEELNLASQFLEAHPGPGTNTLLTYIIHRASGARVRAVDPRITDYLLQRLAQAAAAVRHALRPEAEAAGFPAHALEAIFGGRTRRS